MVRGSDLTAGGNALIAADGKILLEAARNDVEQQTRSSSSSSSAAAGVTVGVGKKGAQFGVTASGSVGRGSAYGADTTWANTHVTAGKTLVLQSGGDTELKGAVASGQRVAGDIGGKLIVESLQDSSTYASKDSNVAASASYGMGGFQANVSASQAKVNADLVSVREQSAIRAGDGGFQIKAKDETVLARGAISSTQAAVDAGANRLETAAVATSNLTNRAHFDAQAISVSAGTGGASAGGGQKSGEASSVTAAGVSGAEVVITDAAKQQALTGQSGETAVASLNRNVTIGVDTSGALTKTWDEQKLKEQVQANAAITQQASGLAFRAVEDYSKAKRTELYAQLKAAETDEDKQRIAQEIKDVTQQERVINVLIGVVTGAGTTTALKEALSAAAGEMRELMIADSTKFKGIVDGDKTYTNLATGESEGVRQDGQKVGGTRWDLDKACGEPNERCATNPDGTLERNAKGQVRWDSQKAGMTFDDFLKTEKGKDLSGTTGGIQGMPGTLGDKPYAPGSWQDKLIEAFAGTHDFIGGKLSGLYDAEGNATRGRSPELITAQDVWSATGAIVVSTPFAMSEVLPPSVWNAISVLLKAR